MFGRWKTFTALGTLLFLVVSASCGGAAPTPAASAAPAASGTTVAAATPAATPTPAYPTKPLTILLGWSAGSASDQGSRALAEATQKAYGQPIIVQNMPGAGSAIAATAVAKAKPDGTTILFTAFGILTQPHIEEVTYDPLKDYVPIMQVGGYVGVLVVQANGPYKTLKDFLAYAKANPGKVRWATSGIGSQPDLSGRLLAEKAGVQMTGIPFNSGAEGVAAVLGGNVDAAISTPGNTLPLIREGKLRALGSTATTKDPKSPEIPTFTEQGYDVTLLGWWAIAAPKGTPDYVIDSLHKAFKTGLETAPYTTWMGNALQPIVYLGPKDTMEMWKTQYALFGSMLKKK